jgi:hypothetical protein
LRLHEFLLRKTAVTQGSKQAACHLTFVASGYI